MYISVRYSWIPNGSALGVLLRMKHWKLFNVLKEMLLPDLSCQRFLWTSFKWVYATLGIGSRDHLCTPQRQCVDAFVGNYIWRNNTGLMSHEVMVRASLSLILLMVFLLYIMFFLKFNDLSDTGHCLYVAKIRDAMVISDGYKLSS